MPTSTTCRGEGGEHSGRIAGAPGRCGVSASSAPRTPSTSNSGIDKQLHPGPPTRGAIRYGNLVGDRFMEITSGPGELRKPAPGATINAQHTQPALDLDAPPGGLKPVLKGLDAEKVNTISSAIIELLQGQVGRCRTCWPTSAFSTALGKRDELIGGVIQQPERGALHRRRTKREILGQRRRAAAIDQRAGEKPDAIAGAIPLLASTTTDLTQLLQNRAGHCRASWKISWPLATESTIRKAEVKMMSSNWARTTCGWPRSAPTGSSLQHLLLLGVAQDQRAGRQ